MVVFNDLPAQFDTPASVLTGPDGRPPAVDNSELVEDLRFRVAAAWAQSLTTWHLVPLANLVEYTRRMRQAREKGMDDMAAAVTPLLMHCVRYLGMATLPPGDTQDLAGQLAPTWTGTFAELLATVDDIRHTPS